MNIVIVGRGVIGVAYGCVLAEAGHSVRHLLRDPSDQAPIPTRVAILDGRSKPPTERIHAYALTPLPLVAGDVDLVIVSVPGSALPGAVATLRERGLDRRMLVMSGVWMERAQLDEVIGHPNYLLGYPIAGGRREANTVESVLFGSVRVETARTETAGLHAVAIAAFRSAGLQVEQSAHMLGWLWLHQAVNAGIISAIAAGYRPGSDMSGHVERALANPIVLQRGIHNIRECLGVVQARGVKLRHHPRDVAPFLLAPAGLAARLMVAMFRRDVLSRRIMELHHNLDDILSLMTEVHETATRLGVPVRQFDHDYALARRMLES